MKKWSMLLHGWTSAFGSRARVDFGRPKLGLGCFALAFALGTPCLAATEQELMLCVSELATPDEMVAACTRVIDHKGLSAQDKSVAYNNRGFAWDRKGDLDSAIADYDEAIRLDPQNAEPYNGRGNARKAQGDASGAIADYDEAINLNLETGGIYFRRGLARYYTDAKGALADLETAFNLAPDYSYGAIWFALAQKANGIAPQFDGIESALDMDRWPAPVLQLLDGKLSEADVRSAAGSTDEKCEAEFYIGALHHVSAEKDQAMKQYETALSICPKSFNEYGAAKMGRSQLMSAN